MPKVDEKMLKSATPAIIVVEGNKNRTAQILQNLKVARSIMFTAMIFVYFMNSIDGFNKAKNTVKKTRDVLKLFSEKGDNPKGE